MGNTSDRDNRANQLNPNNDAYWQSRGYDGRPDDWDEDWDDENLPPQGLPMPFPEPLPGSPF